MWFNDSRKKLRKFFKVAKNLATLTAKISAREKEERIMMFEKTFSNTSKSVVFECLNDGRKKLRKFFK